MQVAEFRFGSVLGFLIIDENDLIKLAKLINLWQWCGS